MWCGLVWCGVVWCGVAWRGVAWRSVRCGVPCSICGVSDGVSWRWHALTHWITPTLPAAIPTGRALLGQCRCRPSFTPRSPPPRAAAMAQIRPTAVWPVSTMLPLAPQRHQTATATSAPGHTSAVSLTPTEEPRRWGRGAAPLE